MKTLTRAACLLALALLAALGACGSPQSTAEQSYSEQAEVAFRDAEEALDDSNYAYALNAFRNVRDTYELSPWAVLAELRIGDVYFEQGTYLQAAEAYRQFVQLHPSHDAVPYARFRIGMSYYEDMPSDFFLLPEPYERELGSTRSARGALGDFLERHGESADPNLQPYVQEAREAYQETIDRLAGYEFYVGTFYLERDRPIAAADHLRSLLEEYPGTSLAPEALFLLARCYVQLADVETALETLATLEQEYPNHQLTDRARDWRARHGL